MNIWLAISHLDESNNIPAAKEDNGKNKPIIGFYCIFA